MNQQEIYDTVARHLLTQNKKAFRKFSGAVTDGAESEQCCYLAPDGSKCAVGCLIPDEMYKVEFEGRNIASLAFNNRTELPKFFLEHLDFLRLLQLIHDNNPPDAWPNLLEEFALENDLVPFKL